MISVIIPTKDDPEIFDAIDSVLNQSYDDFELIVVDASEGALQESLEARCETKDVKYFHEDGIEGFDSGEYGSRNFGISKAEGEIIALLDGDCIADRGWLKNLIPYFENHDIAESNVRYHSEGKNCLMDRTVENSGRNYGFLGAGLSFKKQVWEEQPFRGEFKHLRGDTAFGFDALENNYSYTYAQQAEIDHHSGRFSMRQFVEERMRFQDEPLFYSRYRDHRCLEKELNHLGPVLYPKELAMLGATVFALGVGIYNTVISGAMIAGIMAATTAVYYRREAEKRDLDFCPFDILKLFFLAPITFILVKRLAIWKGAIRDRAVVI
jgi:glycosyltransferase involved in cell wall biosynthesis